MHKFKKNDRVRVVCNHDHDCDVGQVGTVLEDSYSPWVEFDTPTRYPHPARVLSDEGEMVAVGQAGYCDCLCEWWLEPVE